MRWRGALLVGLAALLLVVPVADAASPSAGQVLADEDFGFCHDVDYPLTDREAEWCDVLPQSQPACPAFRSACEAPRAALGGGLGPLSFREIRGDGAAEDAESQGSEKSKGSSESPESPGEPERARGQAGFERDPPEEDPAEALAPDFGPLPQVLVWIIVLAMLVLIITQLRGSVSTRAERGDDREPDPRRSEAANPKTALADEAIDVDGLLSRAQQHAERGNLDSAVTDGYAALIRRLAERELVQLHPSRTNGDHVRDLRGDERLYEPTRRVMGLVERVQFGHAPLTRTEVDDLLVHVRSMLGTLAGVLLVLWTSLACTPTVPGGTREYPWSHSPSGTAGVLELLRGRGLTVEYRLTELEHLSSAGPVPVLLDGVELSDAEWAALLSYVERGGAAVVATRDPLPESLDIGFAVRSPGPLLAGDEPWIASEATVVVPGRDGLAPRSVEWGSVAEVLRADAEGTAYVVSQPRGAGTLIILADDRLLTNASLSVADNGEFLVALLSSVGTRFELVDGGIRSQGEGEDGASDPFDAVGRAHLTPVILQGLLLLLLLYLWRGRHFGRPRDPPARSRRHFTEHAEALAQQYQRAGARRHALRLYAGWALERIHDRYGGGRALSALAARIAARTERDETEIMRILVEAQHARDEDQDPLGDAEDLRILRELGRLLDTPGRR